MADIDVTLASNAPQVSRELDAAEKATRATAAATAALDQVVAKLTGHLRGEADGLKRVTAAAREHSKAIEQFRNGGGRRGMGGFVTSGMSDFGEVAKVRTNVMQALMKMNREVREQASIGGEAAGKAFSTKWGAALSKMGGGLGSVAGRLVGGIGLGGPFAGVAAGAIAVSKAIEIANFALDNHASKLERVAQGALTYARATKSAREMNQAAGMATAQSQGQGITQLVGSGGQAALDQANGLAKQGFSFNDASAAVMSARNRFGARAPEALAIAARAARAGGTTLGENVNGLGGDELDNPELASARLLAVSRNQAGYSADELKATEARIAGSSLATDVGKINGALGARDVNAQSQIGAGVLGAMGAAADAKDPGAKYMLGLYNTAQQELDVLRSVDANMSGWAKVWDWITNPGNTRGQQLGRAEDTAILNAGGGALP